MRALTAQEVYILNAFAEDAPNVVNITGYTPNYLNTTIVMAFNSSRPPQPVTLPKSQARYKQICNPQRQVITSDIWRHESPLDSNGVPKLFTTGYVPSAKSGVTIGYGIDLGTSGSSAQAIATQLTTWGLSPAGLQTLTPYLGLIGPNATNAIATLGAPTISKLDAQTISKNGLNSYIDRASSTFNSLNPNLTFEQIPANGQTALVDVIYWAWSFTSTSLPAGFAAALAQGDMMTAGGLLIATTNSRLQDDGKLLQSTAAEIPKPGQNISCGSVGP